MPSFPCPQLVNSREDLASRYRFAVILRLQHQRAIQARGNGNSSLKRDGGQQNKALIVISVFANQVYATRRLDNQRLCCKLSNEWLGEILDDVRLVDTHWRGFIPPGKYNGFIGFFDIYSPAPGGASIILPAGRKPFP